MDVREALMSPPGTARHPWETARLGIVADLLRRYAPRVWIGESLLADIGCGDFYVIRSLAGMLPQARFLGADNALDLLGITNGADPLGDGRIRLYTDALHALSVADETLDVVLLLDVIEHIDNDADFIASLARQPAVKDNTVFLVTVPAFQHLFSSHDQLLEHRRRYSLSSLLATVERAGLRGIRSGYFFFSLYLARLGQSLLQRIAGTVDQKAGTGIGAYTPRPALDSMMRAVLTLDYRLFSSRPLAAVVPGLSAFCVCRKQP